MHRARRARAPGRQLDVGLSVRLRRRSENPHPAGLAALSGSRQL